MKTKSVKNIIKQFACWILLLQMLNISIDPPDLHQLKSGQFTNKGDLSINEVESIYELISEGVFDKEVPENDENEIDITLETFDLYFFSPACNKLLVFNFPVKHYDCYQNNFSFLFPKPNSPPPKQV